MLEFFLFLQYFLRYNPFVAIGATEMLNKPQVLSKPYEVENRLHELFGFGQKILIQAIVDGLIKRNEATGNHPKTYGGTCHYAEGTAVLREQLIPEGWEAYSISNSDWIRSREHLALINFMVGNSSVGTLQELNSTNASPLKPSKKSHNKNPKGSMFAQIAKNQLEGNTLIPFEVDQGLYCWALMYHIDHKNNVIRSEISCPSNLTSNGKYFSEYYERIILSEVPLESDSYEIAQPSPNDIPPIDFEIKRKA